MIIPKGPINTIPGLVQMMAWRSFNLHLYQHSNRFHFINTEDVH